MWTYPCLAPQVQTRLENPTYYHVLQSQRRQVRQFLSGGGSPQESAPCGTPAPQPWPHSDPGIGPGLATHGTSALMVCSVYTPTVQPWGSVHSHGTTPGDCTPPRYNLGECTLTRYNPEEVYTPTVQLWGSVHSHGTTL